jgi:hypothetical protein
MSGTSGVAASSRVSSGVAFAPADGRGPRRMSLSARSFAACRAHRDAFVPRVRARVERSGRMIARPATCYCVIVLITFLIWLAVWGIKRPPRVRPAGAPRAWRAAASPAPPPPCHRRAKGPSGEQLRLLYRTLWYDDLLHARGGTVRGCRVGRWGTGAALATVGLWVHRCRMMRRAGREWSSSLQ